MMMMMMMYDGNDDGNPLVQHGACQNNLPAV